MFALDTNTVIHFFKGKGRVAQNLAEKAPAEVYLPAVVLYELEVGVAASVAPEKLRRQLVELMSVVEVLPFGAAEALASAEIRDRLRREGALIGPLDVLIAGTAIASGATLVTHNTGEFGRVTGLRLVDWY